MNESKPPYPVSDVRVETSWLPAPASISLRDWFAGQALTPVITGMSVADPAHAAKWCYAMADAMLKQREVK